MVAPAACQSPCGGRPLTDCSRSGSASLNLPASGSASACAAFRRERPLLAGSQTAPGSTPLRLRQNLRQAGREGTRSSPLRSRNLPETLRGTASARLLRFAQMIPPALQPGPASRLVLRSTRLRSLRSYSPQPPFVPLCGRFAPSLALSARIELRPSRSADRRLLPSVARSPACLPLRPTLNPAPFTAFVRSAASVRPSLRLLRSLSCSLRTD